MLLAKTFSYGTWIWLRNNFSYWGQNLNKFQLTHYVLCLFCAKCFSLMWCIRFCACILYPCHNTYIFEECSYQMTLLVTWVNSAGTNLHFLVCGSLWHWSPVTFITTLTRAVYVYYYHLQLKIYISRAWTMLGLCRGEVWGFWSYGMLRNVSG
jgi:hypothetical protein